MTDATVHDQRLCLLGEGALWHPERDELLWFDILGRMLHTADRSFRLPETVNVKAIGAELTDGILRVTLPLAMPGVLAAVLIVFIPVIGDYVTPTLIGGGKIPMIANMIQSQMLDQDNRPMGSALAVTAMLIVAVLSLLFLFLNRRFLGVRS